jgi:hypothetical protein
VGRRGYFDYARDGFGPVTETPDEATAAIIDVLGFGPSPAPAYRRRIEEAFPLRDGRCRERVADAIVASTQRVVSGNHAETPDMGTGVPPGQPA